MREVDELLERAGETLEYAKIFAEQKGNLVRLDLTERISKIVSVMVTNIVLATLGTIVLMFLSVALALFLGQWLHNAALGFAIVSLLYVAVGALVFVFRHKWIANPIISFVITKMYERHDEEDDKFLPEKEKKEEKQAAPMPPKPEAVAKVEVVHHSH